MAKKLVDYHVHTGDLYIKDENPHAIGTWEEYFLLSKKLNLNLIPGNSAHSPHFFSRGDKNLYPFENIKNIRGDNLWEKHINNCLNFKEKNKKALFGIEVDFFEDVSIKDHLEAIKFGYLNFNTTNNKLINKFLKNPFDYVILSCHFLFGRGFDYNYKEFLKLKEENNNDINFIIERYWKNLLLITKLGKKISDELNVKKVIIGHFDLIKIISIYEEKIDIFKGFEKLIDEILENIKKFNLYLEFNINGYFKGVGFYPSDQILKKAKKLKINFCFGSDSHKLYENNIKNFLTYFYAKNLSRA